MNVKFHWSDPQHSFIQVGRINIKELNQASEKELKQDIFYVSALFEDTINNKRNLIICIFVLIMSTFLGACIVLPIMYGNWLYMLFLPFIVTFPIFYCMLIQFTDKIVLKSLRRIVRTRGGEFRNHFYSKYSVLVEYNIDEEIAGFKTLMSLRFFKHNIMAEKDLVDRRAAAMKRKMAFRNSKVVGRFGENGDVDKDASELSKLIGEVTVTEVTEDQICGDFVLEFFGDAKL